MMFSSALYVEGLVIYLKDNKLLLVFTNSFRQLATNVVEKEKYIKVSVGFVTVLKLLMEWMSLLYIQKKVLATGKQSYISQDIILLNIIKRYPGSGNEFADRSTSDIIFQIITVPHVRFTRKGNDLHTKVELTLKEVFLYEFKFISK